MNKTSLLYYYLQTVYHRGRLRVYFIYSTLVAVLISMIINQVVSHQAEASFTDILIVALMYAYSITLWVHLTTSWQLCFTHRSKNIGMNVGSDFDEHQAYHKIVNDHEMQGISKKGFLHFIAFIFLTELGVIAGTIQVVLIKKMMLGNVPPHIHAQMHGTELSIQNFVSIFSFSLGVSSIILVGMFFYERLRLKFERAQMELKAKQLQEIELRRLKTQAELSALQAKINPHFLFNTLNSIASLISFDPTQAEKAVEKLSRLFRLTLDHSLKEEVLLGDSLKTVESYLELEKIRLRSRLEYIIDVKGDMGQTYVPGLLIQPLVENAIKYGISPSIGGGKISLSISLTEYCTIEVENTGNPWSEKASDSGHGLINIRQRLGLLYGENWAMEIQKDSPVMIRIRIPHKADKGVEDELSG
jgi:two-component sensor histidine kinase